MKIEGLRLEVTVAEMQAHFEKRLEHHKKALEHLAATKLVLVSKDGQMGKSDIEKLHKQQVRFLTFITTHMPEGDSFLLSMNEISQLMLLNEVTEYGIDEIT